MTNLASNTKKSRTLPWFKIWYFRIIFPLILCNWGHIDSFAQYDLSLVQSMDKNVVTTGDTVTIKLKINHEYGTIANNIIVTDSISSALAFLGLTSPVNGGLATYNGSTHSISWQLPDLGGSIKIASLDFQVVVTEKGIFYNKAEITNSPNDIDSEAGNNNYLEDDLAISYVSVPISYCPNSSDTLCFTAPIEAMNVNWYRVYDFNQDGSIATGDTVLYSSTNAVNIYQEGTYFHTSNLGECLVGNCGQVIVIPSSNYTENTSLNICQGESVQLNAAIIDSTNSTYKWTPTSGLNNPFIANPIANPTVSTSYIVEKKPGFGACINYDTIRVNVFDVPNPNFNTNAVCLGTATNFMDNSVTYTTITRWFWDFGDSMGTSMEQNPTYTFPNTGQYPVKLVVESTNGCRDSITKEVTVYPNAQAVASAKTDTICAGACVALTAQGGTTFKWSPNLMLDDDNYFSPIACPTETTTYTVTVTNDFGCSSMEEVSVTVIPELSVDVEMTNVTECGKFDGTITINATGLANNYEYSIDGGLTFSTNPTFVNLPASTYFVVVRGSSCEIPYANNPVIIKAGIAPLITDVSLEHPDCSVDNGTITINASGTDLKYSIDGGISFSASNEFTNLAGNTYYIAVSANEHNCITYYPPVKLVQPTAPNITDVRFTHPSDCGKRAGTISIFATGLDGIEYGLDDGMRTIWQSSNNFIQVSAGTYAIYVRNIGDTCITPYANNPVIIEADIAPLITDVSLEHPDCNVDNGAITINASGTDLKYSIDGGINWQDSPNFNRLKPGSYTVLIKNQGSTCTIAYTNNPIEITYPEATQITEVQHSPPTGCGINDGQIEITVENDHTDLIYSVDGGMSWQENNMFNTLTGGIYNIRVANTDESCKIVYPTIELASPSAGTITAVIPTTGCESSNRTIRILASSATPLAYSIDGGITYQASNNFLNLGYGEYRIFIKNINDNCVVAYANNPVEIAGLGNNGHYIAHVQATEPTICEATDGSIEINATGNNLVYSIDGGISYGTQNYFDDLAAGTYLIYVKEAGSTCAENYFFNPVELISVEPPIVSSVITTNGSDCQANDGTIIIKADGEEYLQYSLDGSNWGYSNVFINLLPGFYHAWVRYEDESCEVPYQNNPVEIAGLSNNGHYIAHVQATEPTICEATDGSIEINATGNNLVYSIDGGINYGAQNYFDDLAAGTYSIYVKEEGANCEENYFFNPVELISIEPPIISSVIPTNGSDCKANDGTIIIEADGEGALQYSLDGANWNYDNVFTNLLPGFYHAWVRYEDESCEVSYQNNPIVIKSPILPTITACIGANPTNCHSDDGMITVIASGEQGALYYSIDDGITWQLSNTFTALSAGVYPIMVANEDKTCQVSYPICELIAPEPPIINDILGINPTTCSQDNGSITVLAEGDSGIEYSIDNGTSWSANSYFSNLAAGDYQVKVRNAADNCEVTDRLISLEALSVPTIVSEMENTAICKGNFIPASITLSEAIVHYSISGSGGYLNANVLDSILTFDAYLNGAESNFMVTLENADGCSVVTTFALFQAADSKADFFVNNPICATNDVELSFTGTANSKAVLNWSLDGGTIITTSPATATAPAGATLTVKWSNSGGKTIRLDINDEGCTDSKVQTINVNKLPFADAGTDITLCQGECIPLNGAGNGALFQWSPAIGLSVTDIPNPLACSPITTTYQLLVMDAVGCMIMDEVTVTVGAELVVSAGTNQTICLGENTQLQASGGLSYEWSPSTGLSNPHIANPIASPQVITTYSVTATTEDGCVDTDEVIIDTRSALTVVPSGVAPSCCEENGAIHLAVNGGSGNFTYQWTPAVSLNNTATQLSAGNYSINITDQLGCQVVTNINLQKDCITCLDIIPENEIVVSQNSLFGELCLPIRLSQMGNYSVYVDGMIISPNHGCSFENLTAYSYALLQGKGNSGPYKIEDWSINGTRYTGMVNNMTDLVNWMNTVDSAKNWNHTPQDLLISGGNPLSNYGNLKLIRQATWNETTLGPNIMGVAQGSLVKVPMNNLQITTVTLINNITCCEEQVVFKR